MAPCTHVVVARENPSDVLTKNQETVLKDNDSSTQMETSGKTSTYPGDLSRLPSPQRKRTGTGPRTSKQCASVADHAEESPQLPESANDVAMTCIRNRDSLIANSDLNRRLPRNVELDELAVAIASRMQSKLQTTGCGIVRIQPVHEHLRHAFLQVDDDCDGKLTQAETLAFCQQLGLPSESASQLFTLLGGDETGAVNWEAFLAKYLLLFNAKSLGGHCFGKAF